MTETDHVRELRRELGRALKQARRGAGYTQAQLARRTGYARSTVSTAESGGQNAHRVFWERCTDALGGATALTARYDQVARQIAAQRPQASAGAACQAHAGDGRGLDAGTVAEVMAAYRGLGWRAEDAGGRVELVCGTGAEALEVPRAAGVVAVRWWLHTGGVPDEVRGLPGLPSPRDALAVVAAGDRWFFLVQPGACPWAGQDLAGAAPDGNTPGVVVRWHAGGSRVPAPPSRDGNGRPVAWAHPPPASVRLADPVILLDLLARAAALTRHSGRMLTLPGGVRVVPGSSRASLRAAGSPPGNGVAAAVTCSAD
jgi:DNA-binding XRE family transcriptional regulator